MIINNKYNLYSYLLIVKCIYSMYNIIILNSYSFWQYIMIKKFHICIDGVGYPHVNNCKYWRYVFFTFYIKTKNSRYNKLYDNCFQIKKFLKPKNFSNFFCTRENLFLIV